MLIRRQAVTGRELPLQSPAKRRKKESGTTWVMVLRTKMRTVNVGPETAQRNQALPSHQDLSHDRGLRSTAA
jgi:hypothetical protein